MNKTVKRFLVSGVALAMLATTGTGIASNNTNVNASSRTRISKLESQKRYYSNKLSNINKELARLTHQNKRTKRTKRVRKARVHHEAAYMWYYHNGHRLFKRYINTNKMFRKGYDNANQGCPDLRMDFVHNNHYRQGWIYSCAIHSYTPSGTKQDFKDAMNQYNQGQIYAKNNKQQAVHMGVNGSDHVWINGAWM